MSKYVLFAALLIFTFLSISCTKKSGCLNEWADNYDRSAEIDCCCNFSSDKIIEDLIGSYTLSETCSGNKTEFTIEIRKDEDQIGGIIVDNFNNSGQSIDAQWGLGEFQFSKDWQAYNCEIGVTGSIHKSGGKLNFIYAALKSNNDCEGFQSTTCESRTN